MPSVSRRGVLATLGGVGLTGMAGSASVRAMAAAAVGGGDSRDPVFTFVSMPDFFNGDVADLSVLPSWDHRSNSVNQSWMGAIDKCLGVVKGFNPDAVFLAGDLVEGHWNIDTEDRQLFGPVSQGIDPESLAQCESAITAAGDVHYSFAAGLFSSRGLPLYPAIGDHEILDDRSGKLNNRWNPSGYHHQNPDNRYYLVDHCKDVWADHFTRPDGVRRFARRPVGTAAEWTAYSVSFADQVTLITVDMFTKRPSGVRLGVFQGQLDWMSKEIRRAKRRGHVVIVQGHVPTMTPYRWMASGRLQIPEGRRSAFYRALEREGADLYLCGEVHDTTAMQRGKSAPVQISHGCIFHYAFSFLVGRVYRHGKVRLDLYEAPISRASVEKELWACDSKKKQRTFIEYGDPVHRGKLTMRDRRVLTRTAKLGKYDRFDDPYALAGHLGTILE
jgi:3',5'-cyclic AMP phosphodiesterase CpdA